MSVSDSQIGSSVLVLRIWVDPEQEGSLRARLLSCHAGGEPFTRVVDGSAEDIGVAVKEWVMASGEPLRWGAPAVRWIGDAPVTLRRGTSVVDRALSSR